MPLTAAKKLRHDAELVRQMAGQISLIAVARDLRAEAQALEQWAADLEAAAQAQTGQTPEGFTVRIDSERQNAVATH